MPRNEWDHDYEENPPERGPRRPRRGKKVLRLTHHLYCLERQTSLFDLEQLVRGYPFSGGYKNATFIELRKRYSYLSAMRIRQVAYVVWSDLYWCFGHRFEELAEGYQPWAQWAEVIGCEHQSRVAEYIHSRRPLLRVPKALKGRDLFDVFYEEMRE